MHRLRLALAIAAPLTLGVASSVAAQDSTASPTPLAGVECTVEPRSFDDLMQLLATPASAPEPAIAASPAAATLPAGDPADEDTVAAVQQSVQELTACINEGDLLRALTLYSDRFVHDAFNGATITQEQYDATVDAAEPRPAGEEVVIYSFGDVVIAADGRAAVLVVGDDPQNERPPSTTLFYLVEEDGRWVVDETIQTPDESDA